MTQTKEMIKNKLKEKIEKGDTFDYWLKNDFVENFLSSSGTATNFYLHITENQLKTWSLDIETVKSKLEKEGFRVANIFSNPKKNKKNEFEIFFDGLREYSTELIQKNKEYVQ